MKNFNTPTKMPYAVSLGLIFAYSLLLAVVPPGVIGTHQTTANRATPPGIAPHLVAIDAPVERADQDATPIQ